MRIISPKSIIKLMCVFLCFSICSIMLTSCSCAFKPERMVNTKWVSEDGNFVFYVTPNGKTYGKITVQGAETFIRIDWSVSGSMVLFPGGMTVTSVDNYYYHDDKKPEWDSAGELPKIEETWHFDYGLFNKNKITIKPDSDSCFGLPDEIVLRKQKCTDAEIEYPPIVERPYEYVYLQYKDLFDGNIKERQAIEEKYGEFAYTRIYNEDISVKTAAYYIVPSKYSEDKSYDIKINFYENDTVSSVYLFGEKNNT